MNSFDNKIKWKSKTTKLKTKIMTVTHFSNLKKLLLSKRNNKHLFIKHKKFLIFQIMNSFF